MLKTHRFCIIFILLLILLVSAIGCFVYFLNINDYSDWITKQVKQTTGYDISFSSFENNWLSDSQFSIIDLSLYDKQQRIVFIKQLDLKVEVLDLWRRRLEIDSIRLQGVEVDMQLPFTANTITPQHTRSVTLPRATSESVIWEWLHINHIEIKNLNAFLQHEDKILQLNRAHFVLHDLLLIDQTQLQKMPKNLTFETGFQQLRLSADQQKVTFNNMLLSLDAQPLQREAQFAIKGDGIRIDTENMKPMALTTLQSRIIWQDDKLALSEFSLDIFSGHVSMQAATQLNIVLFPKPALTFKDLVVTSLLAQDMLFTLPTLAEENAATASTEHNNKLPLETLLLEDVQLKNITILNESNQHPLVLQSADLLLKNLYVIQDSQFIALTSVDQQDASFAMAFDYLTWQDVVAETFSIWGTLKEKDPAFEAMKRMISTQ